MENEEKGVTLGRIFKVAFGNWKVFTPVAAIVALACALGIQFGLNPYRGSYSSTFSYSSADLSDDKYADGSAFFFRNLISSTNLNNIKASDEAYASIDVDKLLNNNGISISTDSEEKTYTINLGYKYIKDQSLARKFVRDIAESALKKDAKIVNEGKYDNSLTLFDEADTFEKKVTYLQNQADYLVDQYTVLSNVGKDNNGNTVAKNDVSLPTSVIEQASANSQQILLIIPENFVESMNYRISSNGYVLDYNAPEAKNYSITDATLKEEYDLNKEKIDVLEARIKALGISAAVSSLGEEMEKLILRNEDITYERTAISNKLKNKGKQPADIKGYEAFVNDLASYRANLSSAVDSYKNVLKSAYIDNAEITFEDSSVVKLNGTINIVVNVALSLIVGVVVGGVVTLVVDRKKLVD